MKSFDILDLQQMKNFLDTIVEKASYLDNPTIDQVLKSYELLLNRVKKLEEALEDLTYYCDHDISLGDNTTESFYRARKILNEDS